LVWKERVSPDCYCSDDTIIIVMHHGRSLEPMESVRAPFASNNGAVLVSLSEPSPNSFFCHHQAISYQGYFNNYNHSSFISAIPS
jgi:hypothetical protein